jgi:sec-independent protein translocase protein TatB
MFDIAWSELMLIGAVALVVIGPKDLPKAMRTVGQAVGKVRRMASEFQGQFNDAMREAELHDLKKPVEDVGGSVSSAMSDYKPIEMPKDPPASVALDDAALKEAEAKLAALPGPGPLPPVDIAPSTVATSEPEVAAAPKPKRVRKPKAEVAAEPAAEVEAVVQVKPVVETEAAKPARKRKPKSAAPGEESQA